MALPNKKKGIFLQKPVHCARGEEGEGGERKPEGVGVAVN